MTAEQADPFAVVETLMEQEPAMRLAELSDHLADLEENAQLDVSSWRSGSRRRRSDMTARRRPWTHLSGPARFTTP